MKKILLIILICYMNVYSADWPMWRNNAYRTGAGSDQLPDKLELQWQRSYSPRETVWDDPLNQDLMPYDRVFEPVAKDGNLYLGFNDTDKIVCIDCKSGKEKWAFYTDGPVRLPAACYKNNVYVTSDDGYIYCLNSSDGSLLWKLRGGPSDRKIIGNKRFISTWPARGGVVIYDDTLYFTASIWPFMGTFIYALNPNTGAIIWLNDGTGADWVKQPHNQMSFAGVAPQGTLVATKDFLLVPGGRSVPGCYDRKTGEFLYYYLAKNRKTGGSFIFADDSIFFNHDREKFYNMYDLKTGSGIKTRIGIQPVISDSYYFFSGKNVSAYSKAKPDSLCWSLDVDATGDLIQSGSRLYAAGKTQLTAIDIKNPRVVWQYPIKKIERLAAADNRLFAVSINGDIYAFGPPVKNGKNNMINIPKSFPTAGDDNARKIISTLGIDEGYALVFNPPDIDYLQTLAMVSDLHIIAYTQNTNDLEKWRKSLDIMQLYGKRVHLLAGSPQTVELAPYFASLVLFPDAKQTKNMLTSTLLDKIYQSVRPYGGKIWMNTRKKTLSANHNMPQAKASFLADGLVISREGKLKGAANWTHQYGDIENTLKSDDDLVQLPLGVLWFGGSSNLDVLPRHGHGPPEQVVDGRLFIEGMNCMNARDVYTGRVLWKKEFTSLGTFGTFYNETYSDTPTLQTYNQEHIPGANARGTNFVVTSDLVYIVQGMVCLTLDVETGEQQGVLQLPPLPTGSRAEWGYIGIQGDNLIAGAGFIPFSDYLEGQSKLTQANGLSPSKARKVRDFSNYDRMSSKMLAVMDRHTGKVKWTMVSRVGFIHNAITAHDNTLYCMDKLPPYYAKKLERRGMDFHNKNRLMALDIETGEIKWQLEEPVFGSWLSYSKDYNLLLQATRPSNDMLYGEEGTRMIIHNAGDGSVVWDKNIEYDNPPLLHTDKILTETRAFSLLSGELLQRKHPLTGKDMDWSFKRATSCNYRIASENILTFRSGAAGFADMNGDGGTGHFGGFKSGCTSNLIAADGILNAPDYTRTCQCAYQNQTSLALTYMPGLEYWTTSELEWDGSPIEKMGINLGAPGDRFDQDNVLWLEYPIMAEENPNIGVTIQPENTAKIRRHTFNMTGNKYPWVAASAVIGVQRVEIPLSSDETDDCRYTVRLVFAELEGLKPGDRIFNVTIQNKRVLTDFDILAESKTLDTELIKKFKNITASDNIVIELEASAKAPNSQPLLCGVLVARE